jgi:hypothetical protein
VIATGKPPLALLVLLATGIALPARAQMPDLRTMSGKPLPVPDLPTGTVTVRVVRQTPANAAAGLDVVAVVKAPSGDSRQVTVKTSGDGRAQFEGLATGAQFQAAVSVDGEKLATESFPVPARGGVRIMLIAGLGGSGHDPQSEPASAAAGAAGPAAKAPGQVFRLGAPTGIVEAAADLPKGTLVIELRGPDGQPLSGKNLRLGEIRLNAAQDGREVKVHPGVSDGAGLVRFQDLTTGETAGYAAVVEHEGMRLSTQPFRMPASGGMRGKILALARTRDPAVLQLHPLSKVVVDLREEALAVMIGLTFRNSSQQIFDPGEDGLVIELPEGAVNAQEIEGGEPLEIVPGKLVRLKTPIPPDSAASFVTQVRFGYILPTGGDDRLDVPLRLPVAWPDPFLIVPEKTGLILEAPGLKPLPGNEVDGAGDKVKSFTVPSVAPGSTLALSVAGIPARDRTGRTVAAGLCLMLVAGALVFARPPRSVRATARSDRDALIARREELFAELVTVEEQRKASPQAAGRLVDRRKEIITKLEVVYRDLAALDHD